MSDEGYIIIDGTTYRVPVISINRTAPFLDKAAERNLSGVLTRELIGVYKNHQIVFGPINDPTDYFALYDILTDPTLPFHEVTVPDNGTTTTYQAYFSEVGDKYWKYHNALHTWKGLTVDFIAQSPWKTP